jgi:hypothetical protein
MLMKRNGLIEQWQVASGDQQIRREGDRGDIARSADAQDNIAAGHGDHCKSQITNHQ